MNIFELLWTHRKADTGYEAMTSLAVLTISLVILFGVLVISAITGVGYPLTVVIVIGISGVLAICGFIWTVYTLRKHYKFCIESTQIRRAQTRRVPYPSDAYVRRNLHMKPAESGRRSGRHWIDPLYEWGWNLRNELWRSRPQNRHQPHRTPRLPVTTWENMEHEQPIEDETTGGLRYPEPVDYTQVRTSNRQSCATITRTFPHPFEITSPDLRTSSMSETSMQSTHDDNKST